MDTPEVEGLHVIRPIGAGECGSVHLAEDGAGHVVTLKLFNGLAIRRGLVARMTERLAAGGWPAGVMPVIFSDFEGRPAHRITPLMADVSGDGQIHPRSLQHSLPKHTGEDSWLLVREIARALAGMHEKRVAHGNLKPGNIFFDSNGRVQITDWTLGNMPGIGHFEFTDALLYQPPEQLRENAGYLEEAGYRWDVYAFGTLAFRLLTGKFPRCDETFSKVAPPPGETRRDGIHADLPKIARNLEANGAVTWPDAPKDEVTAGLREWIEACLRLDPQQRPATMAEVVSGFTAVDLRVEREEERENLLDQRRRANRRALRWCFVTGVVSFVAMVLTGLWYLTANRLMMAKADRAREVFVLTADVEKEKQAKEVAEKAAADATHALAYERDLAKARIEGSRLIGDRLFAWAMEKGHRRLPPLDGREQRLKTLERYFLDFIERTAEVPELVDERARIRVQLAEISLASGNTEAAIQRLGEAIEAWKDLPMDAELRFRMATNRLLLALLLQSGNDPRMETAFAEARKELGDIPQTEVDADRLQQLLAILDFHEAQLLAVRGNQTKALEQLMRATQTLNRLADGRPDSVVLRSELAACYLSSATILEGMGNLGDAREVQALAVQEILKLLKENPKDVRLRLDLAGCYGSIAEGAVLSGDIPAAESMSAEAVKLLEEIVREQPDNAEAVSRLAGQIGVRAGLMRDKGDAGAALKSFDDAIRMLEAVKASAQDKAMTTYRLALLWWQKGRMLGMGGKRVEEIELIRRARSSLIQLETEKHPSGPPVEKIQSSSGYLLGDLGHSLQLAGKKDEAKQAFGESVGYWERLLKSRPKSEEYQESLAWCRQRLKELQ